ncbi:MAG: DUF4432 family protein [Bacteroidales bacterium]
MRNKVSYKLNVKEIGENPSCIIKHDSFELDLSHNEKDPPSANRVRVSNGMLDIEMLPSKGFSLGQAWIKGRPLFWEAPADLPDTETIDLWSDEICINGKPAPGFTFLKTLTGGVEMYGLNNWGMPVIKRGKLQPLHGETSNVPAGGIMFTAEGNQCTIEASFTYRTFEGDADKPWYERGSPLFRITRKLVLRDDSTVIRLKDIIENISGQKQTPDWGYHITFRPEEGARYLVPSGHVQVRGGGQLPDDIETWHKAADEDVRTETGIIHKGLVKTKPSGKEETTSLLLYPDKTGIAVSVTPAPYFQTWFCCGGKGSKEFTSRNGESLLKKNWDGMGIEIGSGPLDHDGNIDKSVKYEPVLKPGEKKEINIVIGFIEGDELIKLKRKIESISSPRNPIL